MGDFCSFQKYSPASAKRSESTRYHRYSYKEPDGKRRGLVSFTRNRILEIEDDGNLDLFWDDQHPKASFTFLNFGVSSLVESSIINTLQSRATSLNDSLDILRRLASGRDDNLKDRDYVRAKTMMILAQKFQFR